MRQAGIVPLSTAGRGTAIREWARKNGHDISSRGRISANIVDAFNAAN
ncbi:Lsr2 family protein [Mycobacteroides sp. LB1]|nr:Lsr2 family protein [Mycobacteroides sp. LB1]